MEWYHWYKTAERSVAYTESEARKLILEGKQVAFALVDGRLYFGPYHPAIATELTSLGYTWDELFQTETSWGYMRRNVAPAFAKNNDLQIMLGSDAYGRNPDYDAETYNAVLNWWNRVP